MFIITCKDSLYYTILKMFFCKACTILKMFALFFPTMRPEKF